MEHYPEDVKRIARAGHDIGNHGDHHKYMTRLSEEEQRREIQGAGDKAKALLGVSMELFRPPYGDYDSQVVETAESLGYYVIQWSVDSLDWQGVSVEDMVERVTAATENGSILLFHNDVKNTPEALRQILKILSERGYQFVTVEELIYTDDYRIDATGKQHKNTAG